MIYHVTTRAQLSDPNFRRYFQNWIRQRYEELVGDPDDPFPRPFSRATFRTVRDLENYYFLNGVGDLTYESATEQYHPTINEANSLSVPI